MFMSLVRVPVLFIGSKSEKPLYTLFDTGANVSCINSELAQLLGEPTRLPYPRKFGTASEHPFMEVKQVMYFDFTINEISLFDDFFLVPGLSEEAIIGATTLQKWRIKLDFEHEVVIVDPKVAKLQLL
jgi:hypothetical protein